MSGDFDDMPVYVRLVRCRPGVSADVAVVAGPSAATWSKDDPWGGFDGLLGACVASVGGGHLALANGTSGPMVGVSG